ncbi:hypothetical protein BD779DRAFT_1701192 [Infundibulicybe gibba]|nr:hypothetical protein BD779DRAFT_1701192 [Infundibulicybe gibba]
MNTRATPCPPPNPFVEKTVQGLIALSIAYGLCLSLFLVCAYLLLKPKLTTSARAPCTLREALLLAYITFMFLLSTFTMASDAHVVLGTLGPAPQGCTPAPSRAIGMMPMMFMPADVLGKLGDVAYVLSNWGADALLAWRYLVIFDGSRVRFWVVAMLPGLLLAGSFASGILFLKFAIARDSVMQHTVHLAYAVITLSLNFILTMMIVVRLFIYRQRIQNLMGKKHGTQYTDIISMLVESEALVVVFGILFVGTLRVPKALTAKAIALPLLVQIQVIAPLLIIFRVVQGSAWKRDTMSQLTADINDQLEEKAPPMSKIQFRAAGTATTDSTSDSASGSHNASRKPEHPINQDVPVLNLESEGRTQELE